LSDHLCVWSTAKAQLLWVIKVPTTKFSERKNRFKSLDVEGLGEGVKP